MDILDRKSHPPDSEDSVSDPEDLPGEGFVSEPSREEPHLISERSATESEGLASGSPPPTRSNGKEEGRNDENDSNDTEAPVSSGGRRSQISDGLSESYVSERVYELLPSPIAQVAERFEDARKRDVFLTGALPMWAGALPKVRVRYGEQSHSVNLFTVTVAPPASGKGALLHARGMGKSLDEELSGNGEGRLFLPADVSSAEFKNRLEENPHGVVVDSEIRTYVSSASRGWGGLRDEFLRGFQNEPIEAGRKTDDPIRIPHPSPSIAFSGTPETFQQVIGGTADGLFSRFLFYRFDREMEWHSQFGGSGESELVAERDQSARLLKEVYYGLVGRTTPLRITVGPALQGFLDDTFSALTRRWKKEGVAEAMRASLTRAGLQAVRIGAILSTVREAAWQARFGSGDALLGSREALPMSAVDMEAGLRLTLTYLLHALRVRAELEGRLGQRESLSEKKQKYLAALPEGTFTTADAKEVADRKDVNRRTGQRWLNGFADSNLVAKVEHGTWKKLPTGLKGIKGVESLLSVRSDILHRGSSIPSNL